MSARSPNVDKPAQVITGRFIQQVTDRLAAGQRVRRGLPIWGRIAVDRQLPFICVYRRLPSRTDEGTDHLVTSEASYLTCSARRKLLPGLNDLLRSVVTTMVQEFGSYLIIEVWAGPQAPLDATAITETPIPRYRVVAPSRQSSENMTEGLVHAFGQPKMRGVRSKVKVSIGGRRGPPRLPPLLSEEQEAELGCHLYGLEVDPIYRDPASGERFPLVLKDIRRSLSLALRRTVFEFATRHTTHHPLHFHTLGQRAVVKAVWESDRHLAEASAHFDLLLLITPVNAEAAWHEFRRSRYEREPSFHYRPMPADPVVLKRGVYSAPVERIEDPALARVFREKQNELDLQIGMLQQRNSSRFLPASIQLFGVVEDSLYDLASDMLRLIPPRSREATVGRPLSAQEFAERAQAEFLALQQQDPTLEAKVEIRNDIAGLMVSRGKLLVSNRTKIPPGRVEALIQHEVGTHLLTYHNGKAQRLRLLAMGLAGYDELQEGLAVLSEYLVGGLSRPRLRLLAGRVIAARHLLDGASFAENFQAMHQRYGFSKEISFSIVMRTHRGGGLTKDAIYLRGLRQILIYLHKGGDLEPLWVGKIAAHHIPIVRELQWRGVILPAALTPRYLEQAEAQARLDRLRQGATVLDLCKRSV